MNDGYCATLMDCPASGSDQHIATELFCEAVEAHLGGADNVVDCYAAYAAAFARPLRQHHRGSASGERIAQR